jgi:hydroxymethylpyrimidine/phosphomethylpyrimidine kinase
MGLRVLEERIASEPPSRVKFVELREIWRRCIELERGFWDMALFLAE